MSVLYMGSLTLQVRVTSRSLNRGHSDTPQGLSCQSWLQQTIRHSALLPAPMNEMNPQTEDIDVPLVVDVDGTLLKTDLLAESFLDLLRRTPWRVFHVLVWLFSGKAGLKRRLAECSDLELADLPVNEQLLERIEREKSRGRRIYLASAADEKPVRALAERLGIIDGIFASNGRVNLSGARKADRLIEAFGDQRFDYIGNAAIDLSVWKHSRTALVANASRGLQRRVRRNHPRVEILDGPHGNLMSLLNLLRPRHWLKNLLVFVPLVTAHSLVTDQWLAGLVAFVALSLGASAVYVFNDMLDLPHDRAHPRKRLRPLADGQVDLIHGLWLIPALVGAALLIAAVVGVELILALVFYLILTTIYSFWLKRLALVDVFILALLYTTRIFAGGLAAGIMPSEWLLAFSGFMFLSLAIVKRLSELADARLTLRMQPGGRGYQVSDLMQLNILGAAAGYSAILVLALYLNSDQVIQLYSRPFLLWPVCGVLLFWISRMLLLSYRGEMHDDPLVFVLRDPVSLSVVVVSGVFFGLAI